MTGEELIRQLRQAAAAEGVTVTRFVRPLTCDPNKFLQQLEAARKPTPTTLERIRALIERRPIPPHRNGFARQPQAAGLTRLEAEEMGLPASGRSVTERSSLEAALLRKRHELNMRVLSDMARETRRPGQPLGDRLRELRQELAA